MVALQSFSRRLAQERNLLELFARLQLRGQCRNASAGTMRYRARLEPLPPPPQFITEEYLKLHPKSSRTASRKIKIHNPPLMIQKKKSPVCSEPLKAYDQAQIALLDPSAARTRLFSPDNEDGARVGDVLLVRFRTGEPFAGVLLNIRRRGVDTGILLRNQITRVGTEMWVKIYSPNVTGMEIVQRTAKRARRARLYYMRKPKHDRGSLQGLLERYLKNKAATGRGIAKNNKTKAQTPRKSASRADK